MLSVVQLATQWKSVSKQVVAHRHLPTSVAGGLFVAVICRPFFFAVTCAAAAAAKARSQQVGDVSDSDRSAEHKSKHNKSAARFTGTLK